MDILRRIERIEELLPIIREITLRDANDSQTSRDIQNKLDAVEESLLIWKERYRKNTLSTHMIGNIAKIWEQFEKYYMGICIHEATCGVIKKTN